MHGPIIALTFLITIYHVNLMKMHTLQTLNNTLGFNLILCASLLCSANWILTSIAMALTCTGTVVFYTFIAITLFLICAAYLSEKKDKL